MNMANRVILAFDVTVDEARHIAEKIAGVGPYYEAWNLPIALDELEDMAIPEDKIPHVALRSNHSAELGGEDQFEKMFPRPASE
jgi:hypothetical protein